MADNAEVIKKVLTEWAKTLPHHSYKDFGEKVTVVSANEKPTYIINLHTLYDMRNKVAPFNRPYKGEDIVRTTSTERLTDVFSPTVELKMDFTSQETDILIPGSLKISPCLRCVGEGKGTCDRCSGSNLMPCGDCQGRGKKPCTICQGRGKIVCDACRGSGRVVSSVSSSGSRSDAPCPNCGGTGGPPCGRCQGGKLDCTTCQTKGKVTCTKCQGQGIISCSDCGGAGQMLKGESIHVTYHPIFDRTVIKDANIPPGLIPDDLPVGRQGERIYEQEEAAIATPKDLPTQDGFPKAVFDLLKRAVNAQQKFPSPAQIIRQKLFAEKISVFEVVYKFLSKEYSCWLTPLNNKVVSQDDPFQDLAQVWLNEAQECMLKREYGEAEKLLQKAAAFAKENPYWGEIKERLELCQEQEFQNSCQNASLAMSLAVMVAAGALLSPSHHLFWPVLLLGVAVWVGGVGIGLSLSRRLKAKVYGSQKARWIGSAVLAMVVGLLCSLGFATLSPTKKADREEFNNLLGLWSDTNPADSKAKERVYLTMLVDTYGPMGVDVSSAKNMLEEQARQEEDMARQKAEEDERLAQQRAQASSARKQRANKSRKSATKKPAPKKTSSKKTKKSRR